MQYCFERGDLSPTFHSKTNIRHEHIEKNILSSRRGERKLAPVINIDRFSDNTYTEEGKNTEWFHRFVARTWQRYLPDYRGSENIFFSFFFSFPPSLPFFSSTYRIGIGGSFHYEAIVSTCCAYGTSFYFDGNDPLSPWNFPLIADKLMPPDEHASQRWLVRFTAYPANPMIGRMKHRHAFLHRFA